MFSSKFPKYGNLNIVSALPIEFLLKYEKQKVAIKFHFCNFQRTKSDTLFRNRAWDEKVELIYVLSLDCWGKKCFVGILQKLNYANKARSPQIKLFFPVTLHKVISINISAIIFDDLDIACKVFPLQVITKIWKVHNQALLLRFFMESLSVWRDIALCTTSVESFPNNEKCV